MVSEALSEIERVTDANELSTHGRTWGFNEWTHGETGRPGGSDDQAWSAGTFVFACHVLTAGDISI